MYLQMSFIFYLYYFSGNGEEKIKVESVKNEWKEVKDGSDSSMTSEELVQCMDKLDKEIIDVEQQIVTLKEKQVTVCSL